MGSFLPFLAVSAIVIATPGPDMALTLRNTLLGGRGGGIATALGVAGGQLIWVAATSIGAVALLVASEPLFLAVKYAGAAYLVVLGAQALITALRRSGPPIAVRAGSARLGPAAALRQGMVSNLGNPKMAVFFASLLPQFAPPGAASVRALLSLGLVFCLMTILWLTGYALAVARAGDLMRRPAIRRTLEAVTGTVLIGLGLRLAAERR